MADYDDFEILDDTSSFDDPVFELIDVNGDKETYTSSKTPDLVLPFLIPTPLVEESSQVVEQQTFTPIVNTPAPSSPVKTTISHTLFVPIKQTIVHPPPTPRIFAPVPLLPKAPPLRRYGDAASIPHHLDMAIDINTIIEKSRQNQQNALHISNQQRQDIQTNFDEMASGSAFSNVLKAKEDLQKSSEQLEQEKRSVLAQRVPALQLDGKTKEDLVEKAKQFHNLLQQLHGAIYELTERFERQKYDMVELTERARQIEKGKAKTRKSNIVHTGLGGGLFAGVSDVTAKAPPKVSLFSRYERLTDRRTFKDRRDVWAADKPSNQVVAERPKAKIKQVSESSSEAVPRRTKRAPTQSEDKPQEDLPPPPAEEEETADAEEQPAEEEEQAEEAPAEAEPEAEAEEEEEEE